MTIVSKSKTISAELKMKGDYYFCGGLRKPHESDYFDSAFMEYTKSIANAPPMSHQLSSSYGKRAEILCRLKLYTDSLNDIQQALDNNCPDNQKTKYYLLKAKCLKVLSHSINNDHDINRAYQDAKYWIKNMNNNMRKKYEKLLFEQINDNLIDAGIFKKWNYDKFIPILNNRHVNLPSLSDSVGLKYSRRFGRHIFAKKNIKPGEIIAIERPYAKIYYGDMKLRFCCHCGEQMWSSLPCDSCNIMMFCSNKCRDDANDDYHAIECQVLKFIQKFNLQDEYFIVTRIICKAIVEADCSLDTLKNDLDKIHAEKNPLKRGFVNEIFESNKISSIYSLLGHSVKDNFNSKIHINSILISYLLITKTNVSSSGILNDRNFDNLKDNYMFIWLIKLVQKLILICNTNSLSLVGFGDKPEGLFQGIYTNISLFNHSCCPTVASSTQCDKLILTAIQPIAKGQQVYYNYAQHYRANEKKDRQLELFKYYKFICKCKACEKNWPVELENSKFNKKIYCFFFNYDRIIKKFTNVCNDLSSIVMYCENFKNYDDELPDILKTINDASDVISKLYYYCGKNSSEYLLAVDTFEWFFRSWNTPNLKLS
ncbi:SET and MYND domain-containing protein 4-like [Aphidius gifuensis]|nr:SET and MYND domain-containing protein 4-like [Aphidius gifuensis]